MNGRHAPVLLERLVFATEAIGGLVEFVDHAVPVGRVGGDGVLAQGRQVQIDKRVVRVAV